VVKTFAITKHPAKQVFMSKLHLLKFYNFSNRESSIPGPSTVARIGFPTRVHFGASPNLTDFAVLSIKNCSWVFRYPVYRKKQK